jgi:hypothetical protein
MPAACDKFTMIKELEAVNSVDCGHRTESWNNLNHYIFAFHDSAFACTDDEIIVQAVRHGAGDLSDNPRSA